jgi:hypothetical protein
LAAGNDSGVILEPWFATVDTAHQAASERSRTFSGLIRIQENQFIWLEKLIFLIHI